MPPHRLSRDEARRIIVRAQLLDADRPADVVEVAEQLGAIKIDPTAVIAPAEQTVPWARIGWSYEPGQLTKAVETDRQLFELDGAFLPVSRIGARLAVTAARGLHATTMRWLDANARFRADVLARLRADGPLHASDIDDTSQVARDNASGWYSDNQVPRMLEALSLLGEVAVSGRVGRQKTWDLAERVYPADLPRPDAEAAEAQLQRQRLAAAGLAAERSAWTRVGAAGDPALIEGSTKKWRVDPEAIAALDDDPGGRAAILNPYDPVLVDRPRLREVFGFDYVLEQFKPKAQRRFGYFAHPVLVGDRFVAQLDAEVDRRRETLTVNALHELTPIDDDEHEMIRAEIADLAQWLGVEIAGRG